MTKIGQNVVVGKWKCSSVSVHALKKVDSDRLLANNYLLFCFYLYFCSNLLISRAINPIQPLNHSNFNHALFKLIKSHPYPSGPNTTFPNILHTTTCQRISKLFSSNLIPLLHVSPSSKHGKYIWHNNITVNI